MIPILFEIGPFKVGSFGATMVAAFLVCVYLLQREFKRVGHPAEWAVNIVFIGAVGGIVGARLYFIIEYFGEFVQDPAAMIFSGSGLTWYGGFIGGFLAISWYIRRLSAPWLQIADLVAPLVLLGHAIGRIGCILAGDGDYGPPSDVPWAMSFPDGLVPTTVSVHPTPIYDSLMSLVLFSILLRIRKRISIRGLIVGGLLMSYGTVRFISEFFRTTPKILFGWMTAAQLLSLLAIILGAAWIIFRLKNAQSQNPTSSADQPAA